MSKEARPRNRAGFQFINRKMKWCVTYRGKDDKQATMLADADSRDTLFGVLHDKGINAIRVEAANDAKAAAISIPFALQVFAFPLLQTMARSFPSAAIWDLVT